MCNNIYCLHCLHLILCFIGVCIFCGWFFYFFFHVFKTLVFEFGLASQFKSDFTLILNVLEIKIVLKYIKPHVL